MNRRSLTLACLAIIVASSVARLMLLQSRAFDADELQHAHAAWAFHQGLLPFRDFFEHHMPGLYYLLAPLFAWFDVAARPDDATRFLIAARMLMWVFATASVVLTVLIGTEYGGAAVGWLSGALLSLSVVFIGRALEIRPDVPALAFWLASLLSLLLATSAAPPGRRRLWFGAAGLMLGAALMFNQKALFVGPGLAVFVIWYLRDARRTSGLRPAMLDVTAFGLTCLAPLMAVAAHFWWQGALPALLQDVLGNAKWIQEVSATSTLHWMLLRDPMLSAIAGAGMVQAGLLVARAPWATHKTIILGLPTASLLVGLTIIPTPYPQYMLMVLPAAAIFGATLIWTAMESIAAGTPLDKVGPGSLVVALACFTIAVVGLAIARPFFLHPAVYPIFGVTALAMAGVFAARRRPDAAATVLVVAISAYSAQQVRWMQGLSNAEAMQTMQYVERETKPSDEVMDGFSGLAWFRPQSSFYWFVSSGVRARLTAQEVTQFSATLNDCARRPRLVILDAHLRALSTEVEPAVKRHYDPTPIPSIWLSKDDRAACSRSVNNGNEHP